MLTISMLRRYGRHIMQSEREIINGSWYYYLKATGKWHVFVHKTPHMIKIEENINTLQEAKQIARDYSKKGFIK